MTFTRVTAFLSGLGLVATWMAQVPPAPLTSAPTASGDAPHGISHEAPLPVIHVDTDRLRAGERPRPAFDAPHRNPFQFADRVTASARASGYVPAPVPPPPMPVAPPPSYTLSGMAEDAGADGPVRTAVIAGRRDIFLVHEGDVLEGRYRVVAIGADAVELHADDDGTTLILRLK